MRPLPFRRPTRDPLQGMTAFSQVYARSHGGRPVGFARTTVRGDAARRFRPSRSPPATSPSTSPSSATSGSARRPPPKAPSSPAGDCERSFEQALAEHAVLAPRYDELALCEEQHGEGACAPVEAAGGVPASPTTEEATQAGGRASFMPFFMGYMIGNTLSSNRPGGYAGRPVYRDAQGQFFTSEGAVGFCRSGPQGARHAGAGAGAGAHARGGAHDPRDGQCPRRLRCGAGRLLRRVRPRAPDVRGAEP